MKIAILSDIHDQKANLELALSQIKEQGIQQALVLGDFCAPPTVLQLVQSELKCLCIFGNNDGDRARMKEIAATSNGRVAFSQQEFDEYEIEDKKVFVTHYPEIAKSVADSGGFDAVFYGHDHQRYLEVLQNGTLLLNPGEIWGWLNGVSSYAIWDTEINQADIIEVAKME